MLIDRITIHKIKKYLSEKGEDVILLYGPRQAGKTTIIKEILRQIGYECKFSVKKSISAPLDWQRAYPSAKFELVMPENFKKYLIPDTKYKT